MGLFFSVVYRVKVKNTRIVVYYYITFDAAESLTITPLVFLIVGRGGGSHLRGHACQHDSVRAGKL